MHSEFIEVTIKPLSNKRCQKNSKRNHHRSVSSRRGKNQEARGPKGVAQGVPIVSFANESGEQNIARGAWDDAVAMAHGVPHELCKGIGRVRG